MNFNDIEWHDVAIEKYEINRSNPGINDSIIFFLIDNYGKRIKLEFTDVYQAFFDLNFGVIPCENMETINYAYQEGNDNSSVQNLYKLWHGFLDNIYLNYYEFILNSTGSIIKIIAKNFIYEEL